MKRRAITGISMNRRSVVRSLHQLKMEDQALQQALEEDEKVRAKSLTYQQLHTLLQEEGIELIGGRLFVPLSWVAVTRRPAVKSTLALIPRAR